METMPPVGNQATADVDQHGDVADEDAGSDADGDTTGDAEGEGDAEPATKRSRFQ